MRSLLNPAINVCHCNVVFKKCGDAVRDDYLRPPHFYVKCALAQCAVLMFHDVFLEEIK